MGMDDMLTRAAKRHSDDQAKMKKMTHDGSDGSSPSDRITKVGFKWNSVAENVAYGYSDEDTCMAAWMKSPGHKANILSKNQLFGSAASSGGGTLYYTQDFGSDGKGVRNVPKCDGVTLAKKTIKKKKKNKVSKKILF